MALPPNNSPYPIPPNEMERLAALHSHRILDTDPEPAFDRIVSLAARLFGAPIAFISLVDRDRQWFKARQGIPVVETPRELSFCTHTILGFGAMVVSDATEDVRFKGNPFVAGDMALRFYAGAPLIDSDGFALGTIAVVDTFIRERPSPELLHALTDLAFLVVGQIEARSAISRYRQAEGQHVEKFDAARQAADLANRAKSDFLARVGHEIRTPMNLIMGMNSLLLESPLNEKQKQHVEISYRNVRRLLRLINGILDLSKAELGDLTFKAIPFDLPDLLSECAATISSAVEKKGLQLYVSMEPATWPYWTGDPERVQQVLLNLIGNSVKFTERGKIELHIRPAKTAAEEPGLRFELTDTGCGVAKDKRDMIFEAFQQAEGSVNRSYEGSGLGLSIARTLVEKMAGRIWMDESREAGAKFIFTIFLLPASEEAVRARVASAALAKIQQTLNTGTRILLVEDNPENVILVQAYLENLPLRLDLAANGLEGSEKRYAEQYDLILMDIQMPIMDGYTATRKIREWEIAKGTPRVPIVALTAHASVGSAGASLEADYDGHLAKPVERADLVAAIAKFTGGQKSSVDEISQAIMARQPSFLANRWLDLEKMHDALATGNFALIKSIGHNCKGTGKGYGFPEISEIGSAIETGAKELDRDKVRDSMVQFERFVLAASNSIGSSRE